MDFRITQNLTSQKQYFYVDSRRVTQSVYDFYRSLENLSGKKENCHHIRINKNKSIFTYSMN